MPRAPEIVARHKEQVIFFQRVAAKCAGQTADLSVYKKNRDLLYDGLIKLGFSFVKPQGAFYIFPRSLEPDAAAFCSNALEKTWCIYIAEGAPRPANSGIGSFRIHQFIRHKHIANALTRERKGFAV